MIYPSNFEQKIGFDTIRELLNAGCLCSLGRKKVEAITFITNFNHLTAVLNDCYEAKMLFQLEDEFPQSNYLDLTKCLRRIRTDGTFITQEELFDLHKSLTTIQNILSFFKNKEEKYPNLTAKAGDVESNKEIISAIAQILNDKGEIKDNASQELLAIRTKISSKRASISRIMQSKLKVALQEGWVEEGTTLSIRDGRMVLPVISSYKRKINGFMHDESATGKTAFIEPSEAFETNNEIQRLLSDEKHEITKILLAFTASIRPYLEELLLSYDFLAEIDFLRAKGRMAIDLDAHLPDMHNEQIVKFEGAKHPLLIRSFRKHKKEVVPLKIRLDEKQRIILISGPNAGGKSVCLKTVGLLQYMLQCGLLIPVNHHSEAGIFDNIFIDIGDEQSLENDLSTYSSHLTNMKHFALHGNHKTLVFIDEFGTGTEPLLGGAIAESILAELNNNGVFGVINTHYTNLKHFAEKAEDVINGAMLFDSENMRPLFKLRMGTPGSSFAFEIAKNIGIPKHILQRAEDTVGKEHVDFDKNLKELEKEKQFVFRKKQEITNRNESLQNQLNKYQQELEKISERKQKIIDDAKKKADQILAEANKKIELTIKEIRESNADKERTIKARERLNEFKNKVEEKGSESNPEIEKQIEKIKQRQERRRKQKQENREKALLPEAEKTKVVVEQIDPELKVGDKVKISGQDATGEIVEMNDKHVVVGFGLLQTKTTVNKIEKVGNASKRTPQVRVNTHMSNYNVHEKRLNFKSEIDVRGMRGDEAMSAIHEFVEQAVMFDMNQLMILHGKGNGILRKLIRNYLRSNSDVKSYSDAHVDMGGAGITVVEL